MPGLMARERQLTLGVGFMGWPPPRALGCERQGRICRELQPSPGLSAHACCLTELQICHQEESRVGSGLECVADAGDGGVGQEKPSGPPGTSPVFLGPVTG